MTEAQRSERVAAVISYDRSVQENEALEAEEVERIERALGSELPLKKNTPKDDEGSGE